MLLYRLSEAANSGVSPRGSRSHEGISACTGPEHAGAAGNTTAFVSNSANQVFFLWSAIMMASANAIDLGVRAPMA